MEQNNNNGQTPETIIEASGWRFLEDYEDSPYRVDKYIRLGVKWMYHVVENGSGEAEDMWLHDYFHYPDTPAISETKEAAIEQHKKEEADTEARHERSKERRKKDIYDIVAYIRSKFPELDFDIMKLIVNAASGVDDPYIQGEKWILERGWAKERDNLAWFILEALENGGVNTMDGMFIPFGSVCHVEYTDEEDTTVITVMYGEKFSFKGKRVFEAIRTAKKILMR